MSLGKTLAEIRRMPASELIEWRAMYDIHPWGEERADLRMGLTVANLLTPHLKRGASVSPAQFMPQFLPKKPMDGNRVMAFFKNLAQRMGGTIRHGNH